MIPQTVRNVALQYGWEEIEVDRSTWKMRFGKFEKVEPTTWKDKMLQKLGLQKIEKRKLQEIEYMALTGDITLKDYRFKQELSLTTPRASGREIMSTFRNSMINLI